MTSFAPAITRRERTIRTLAGLAFAALFAWALWVVFL